MKKIIALTALCIGCLLPAAAQKFAMVDMEYIMSNIPAYERANEQLNQTSKKWQAEVEALDNQAKTLYKNYQNEAVFLSEAQKKEREQAIVDKEKEASELRKKYFGPQGELYKKRIALIEPIQDEVYNAIKGIAQQRGYQLVLDRATETAGIIFASPSIDISNEVLAKLGYEK
ncbi:MAG: OmpH family outer membrane protein [Alloprevotella sp.]|nr:OmpH family outer membrane protein [Bacteroidales bacterium]MDY2604616.1 OmpH family outer membrane protein [Alloprevotella sp.]MCI6104520.1 OmpH family outer membrane protein [Bacteroidales bacterium]MCI6252974.1 OmpH family outer membrane protein [Bacteroidales bacterium]MCI7646386.1 OmpH family outer membrane protein [Bacteroidales bacterium]